MNLNLRQLEVDLEKLSKKIDRDNFIFDLLLSYGSPKASITRLRKGSLNLAKADDEIIWKKKLFFKEVTGEDIHVAANKLQAGPLPKKHDTRFIVVTDYVTLLAVDIKNGDTLDIPISDVSRHLDFFLPWAGLEKAQFQAGNPADIKAAEKMGRLYDILLQDNRFEGDEQKHHLNVFLSRLLFCFFAEDTKIFENGQFTNSIASHTKEDGRDLQEYLTRLFQVLNLQDRGSIPEYLRSFPYVNGGLFQKDYPVPTFSRKSRKMIIDCGSLDWAAINPDIFGSMIQAVVHSDQRGDLGMHYTSVENIMKVIEPLFLNDLYSEFENAGDNSKKLEKLLARLYRIKILDPACGSGNFLIISYKELCKIEIQIFQKLQKGQRSFRFMENIKLSQFYGIELDDFAHETAKLSLWLAEHQMNLAFEQVFTETRPTLPLQEGGNIHCANALKVDWEKICTKEDEDEVYVIGNPPYLGARNQSKSQKADLAELFDNHKDYKDSDYVCGWFLKGAEYIAGSKAQLAFVATNSIAQGEQVAYLWSRVLTSTEIGFAHQSFKWSNNAKYNAGVVCVVVGLRVPTPKPKVLFSENAAITVKNISPYLREGSNVIARVSKESISNLPKMVMGNMARDGGNLIFPKDVADALVRDYPESKQFIRELYGAQEFLKSQPRYCLWITDDNLDAAKKIPPIRERIDKVYAFRTASKAKTTQQYATIPHKFAQRSFKPGSKLILPQVSSDRREYIPFGFLDDKAIVSNLAQVIYDAEPYLFAVVSSRMHMTWVRAVAGRMGTGYRYSSTLCYNTFPMPDISTNQKNTLEDHVFKILDLREAHSEKSLAELYDPKQMPKELLEAHQEMDVEIEKIYRKKSFQDDTERLEFLFKLYVEITQECVVGD